VVAETTPVASVARTAFLVPEIVSAVVDAVAEKRFVAVRAVDDAYGNTEAVVEVAVNDGAVMVL
jgi:hypothetical protein